MTEVKNVKVKKNLSFYFLLPMLGGKVLTINDFDNIENCFLKDKDKPYEDSLFVLFNYSTSKEFAKFEESLTQHPYFAETYDPSPKLTMFVFGIPDIKNYNLFLKGKYSRMSNEYKTNILRFFLGIAKLYLIEDVLYKSQTRRLRLEQELAIRVSKDIDLLDLPDIKKETFSSEYLKLYDR